MDFKSRSDVVTYLCERHNEVNLRLGKPQFDCGAIWDEYGVERPVESEQGGDEDSDV